MECSRVVQPRQRQRSASTVGLAALAVFALASRFSPLASAGGPPTRYVLRVCQKCVSRGAGNGYNPIETLAATAQMAEEAGWPAPIVEYGKCTGNCEEGPTVRLCKGEIAIPATVEGMSPLELQAKAFLAVGSDAQAERLFGLTSRQIAASMEGFGDEEEEASVEVPV
eukprot:TRINITY_DN77059_c0_g1_i1.p1 TRINITY_DN77059_c0_g1~~TRINITY_DN77059_c0_g1_i1.p1  ORF type:complete len:168 (-),score=32.62 TRINITY_DN77059_c0_g1_i1:43-546(-)